jgi:hypothetical protein
LKRVLRFFSILDVTTGLECTKRTLSYKTKKPTHTHTLNEAMALRGKNSVGIKIINNDQTLSGVSYSKFLGNDLPFDHHDVMKNKLHISKIRVETYERTLRINKRKMSYSNSMRESLCLLYFMHAKPGLLQ